MPLQNPYISYRQNSVKTASAEEMVVLMYKGAEKFIKQSIIFIENGQIEDANNAIIRAQDIVFELMRSLDGEQDISARLYNLYQFIISGLMNGNIKKDVKKLKEVLEIVSDLREGWEQALVKVRQLKYGK